MEHLDKLFYGVFSLLTLGLVRHWLFKLDKKVDSFIEAHHKCREELPTKYADRTDTRADIKELYARTDGQGRTLERVKGRLNGATA